jgi:hypothetical protein
MCKWGIASVKQEQPAGIKPKQEGGKKCSAHETQAVCRRN